MKNKVLALLMLLVFVSCKKNEDEPQPTGERVILIYMLTDNSLGYANAHRNDIDEMSKAVGLAQTNGARILLYIDEAGTSPQLIELERNAGQHVNKKLIKSYPNRNSATGEVLAEIINDVEKVAPSKRRGLILWSHAIGWLPPLGGNENTLKSFGVDEDNEMSIIDLANAIPSEYYDFIIADACYMACVEVAFQLREKTKNYISYPTEVLQSGMPYHKVLPLLNRVRISYYDVCKEIYESFTASGEEVAVTAIDCTKLENLAEIAKNVTSQEVNTKEIKNYISYTNEDREQFADLKQILCVQRDALNTQLDIESVISEVVTTYLHTPQFLDVQLPGESCGLAMADYFRCSAKDQMYLDNFDWWKAVK